MSKSPAPEFNFDWVGKRIKRRRIELGLSAQKVAEYAGISRQTLVRLEAGDETKRSTLTKVIKILRLWSDGLRKVMDDDAKCAVNRVEEIHWCVSIPKRTYQKHGLEEGDTIHIDDPAERRRLGILGLQPFYTAIVGVQLPGGLMEQAMMELHQPSWVDQHYGEEFIYCLRGEVLITVDGVPNLLRQGDSMCFLANQPHQYAPGHELEKGEEAPQILLVVAMQEEDKRHEWLRSMNQLKPAEGQPGPVRD